MNHISSVFVYIIYILYIIIPVKVFAPTAKTLEMFCPLRDRIKNHISYIFVYIYILYILYAAQRNHSILLIHYLTLSSLKKEIDLVVVDIKKVSLF